jgi:inner membrane transporter RhtA
VPRGALATRRLSRPRALGDSVPPTGLVLLAVGSVQFGAALARTLFDDLGAGGTVFLRVLFAALVLWALWRPRIRGHTRGELALACAFGLSLAGMNLAFYEALGRIPLGVAVTFEFVGPLGVAVAGSRRALDLLWVALAAAGIVLLTDLGQGGGLNAAGVGFALLAGAFWAAYIHLSARTGRVFPGGAGLALAMALGALVLVPVGVASGGNALLEPRLLALGAAVAMLSSAIPYSLELEALRRLPPRVFGVLMSLEPAVAAIAGLVVLGQVLRARELVAIALVVAASAGATRTAPTPPRDA